MKTRLEICQNCHEQLIGISYLVNFQNIQVYMNNKVIEQKKKRTIKSKCEETRTIH